MDRIGIVRFAWTRGLLLGSIIMGGLASQASAGITVFEANGVTSASITPSRDAFRVAVGGGTVAGADGDFGGLRREIDWDSVPAGSSDPTLMAADFLNTTSPRGVVFGTPGTGFLVSSNAGDPSPTLFGFSSDFQTFSSQKLFTAVNSNVLDVNFFVPGTATPATTSAFGLVFVDAEVAGLTKVEFFDATNSLIFSRDALVGGNQGLSFLGGVANAGERIARVRITSGLNTIVSNGVLGNPNDDVVVMDDFLYATPAAAVPEPWSVSLFGISVLALGLKRRSLKRK